MIKYTIVAIVMVLAIAGAVTKIHADSGTMIICGANGCTPVLISTSGTSSSLPASQTILIPTNGGYGWRW